jgi:hypothetical protein
VPPYNPLDKLNLGKSVAEALLDQEAHPLVGMPAFNGAGIYAIYYSGQHPAYRALANSNRDGANVPIYVGKAIPSGGRKGVLGPPKVEGNALARRLQDHAESIADAGNLDITDFRARWLTVDDIWIPLGETLLITKFRPVWNLALDGFGNHDPGAGRYQGLRPMWDTLHPGRAWAEKCRVRPETQDELRDRIGAFLREHPPEIGPVDFDPNAAGG